MRSKCGFVVASDEEGLEEDEDAVEAEAFRRVEPARALGRERGGPCLDALEEKAAVALDPEVSAPKSKENDEFAEASKELERSTGRSKSVQKVAQSSHNRRERKEGWQLSRIYEAYN
jgi:hypothetical protein